MKNMTGRWMVWCTWLFVLFCFGANQLPAQQARYRLGKQVIGFETDFQEQMQDIEKRRLVLSPLENAVQSFFRLALTDAEPSIDKAWLALQPKESQPKLEALAPLRLELARHWVDAGAVDLAIKIEPAYSSKSELTLPLKLKLRFIDQNGEAVSSQDIIVDAIPFNHSLALKGLGEGDYRVDALLEADSVAWRMPPQLFSCSRDLEVRYEKLRTWLEAQKNQEKKTLLRTVQLNANILRDARSGRVLETDYPAHSILTQLESWQEGYQGDSQSLKIQAPGEYWLELQGKSRSTVVRVNLPTKIDPNQAAPLLVAFHGAGGSENMFFDAYGAGEIVKFSKEAGYVLVCPRQPLLGGILPIEELIGQLSDMMPINRDRVAALGHSMGAAQTIAQVEGAKAGTVQAAVILGGGRGVSKEDKWKGVPVFAGAGDRDFGRRGVEQFADTCRTTGAVVREEIYEAVEHLGIVQVALPDVFQWLQPLLNK